MAIALTPRMKNWIEGLGVHCAVATKTGFPTVIVVTTCQVQDHIVTIPLSLKQLEQIKDIVKENPQVALAPGQIGAVRAPYQFKGKARIEDNNLLVAVDEIYCTKPGPEAGLRLDVLGYEKMRGFEESRWKDLQPPQAK